MRALVAVAALAIGFGLLAVEMMEGETLAFDSAVLYALHTAPPESLPIGPPWLREAARDVTALGSFTLLFPMVAIVAVFLLLEGKPRNAVSLVAASATGALLSTFLKMAFDRPRPDFGGTVQVFTASFPSGHALASAVVFLTAGTFLARAAHLRRVKYFSLGVAIALTLLVGASRVYLGVHYPTDVLAGWMLGAGWAILCALAADWYFGPASGH